MNLSGEWRGDSVFRCGGQKFDLSATFLHFASEIRSVKGAMLISLPDSHIVEFPAAWKGSVLGDQFNCVMTNGADDSWTYQGLILRQGDYDVIWGQFQSHERHPKGCCFPGGKFHLARKRPGDHAERQIEKRVLEKTP